MGLVKTRKRLVRVSHIGIIFAANCFLVAGPK